MRNIGKIAVLAIAASLASCASKSANDKAPTESKGSMQIDNIIVDFGDVPSGDVVGTTLHYKAVGGSVAISRIEKNCPCVDVRTTDADENAQGDIYIILDTHGLMGKEVQPVQLYSANDTVEIIISAHINN
ncbi:MAG: DUF1573 domain-containing protein [Bacteroidales bacterium]|jgi:hypothetical protein|nr:DUF1573 domain-containing protein [Bacteroidales bacterium]